MEYEATEYVQKDGETVMSSPGSQTWRGLLGEIIGDVSEKRRLIKALQISPVTLMRWVDGTSTPRRHNLQQLLKALSPAYRERMQALLPEGEKLQDVMWSGQSVLPRVVLSDIYERALHVRATTSPKLRFWSLCQLILQHALGQLDPENHGMSIWVIGCMPPSGPYQKVRSLRGNVGLGTPPWMGNLEQEAMFLGAESLIGDVVTRCHPVIVQDVRKEHNLLFSAHGEQGMSVAMYPLLYVGRVAGALMVSSKVVNYFLSELRTDLIQHYAYLITLAFASTDFYEPDQIALEMMLPYAEQAVSFARFRQLMTETMLDAAAHKVPMNNIEIDLKVWGRLEEELINRSATFD
jgi:hypothetical protein